MSRVTFSPAAVADIEGIWDYTAATWGIDQAERYTDDIQGVCQDLAINAIKGRLVDVRPGYLKFAVGRHFVFYTRADDGVAVVRDLHQQMDVERHLQAG